MIPQLEKKHMHAIGIPRLSFQDTLTAAAARSNAGKFAMAATSSAAKASASVFGSTTSLLINSSADADANPECAAKPKGRYLLAVNRDKYVIHYDEYTGQPTLAPLRVDASGADDDADASPSIHSQRATPDWEAIMHSRKFGRHMRLTRRSHCHNPNSLPALSMLS